MSEPTTTRPRSGRPSAHVRIHTLTTGPWVPSLLIRALPLLLSVLIALTATQVTLWRGVIILIGIGASAVPAVLLCWVLAAATAAVTLVGDASWSRTALAMLYVHLCHVLGCLTTMLEPRGRVVLRALWPTARRFVVIQLIGQLLGLGVVELLTPDRGHGIGWYAPVGALGVVGLAVLLLWLAQRNDAIGVGHLWRRQR